MLRSDQISRRALRWNCPLASLFRLLLKMKVVFFPWKVGYASNPSE